MSRSPSPPVPTGAAAPDGGVLTRAARRTVSVCLPATTGPTTIAAVVACCTRLRELGVGDEIVVVVEDAGDETAERAEAAGAVVHEQAALLPEWGPLRGRGDAMWRALSVLSGDLVVFLDTERAVPVPGVVTALLSPLARDRSVRLVKGYERPPFAIGGPAAPRGDGALGEPATRALLRRCFPSLAAVRQPFRGELAADRELLLALPFHPGHAVLAGLLIDTVRACGPGAIAQADLRVRRLHRAPRALPHGRLVELADLILDRAAGAGAPEGPGVRPPMRDVLRSAAAG